MTYAGSIHSRELVRTSKDYPTKLYIFKMAFEGVFPNKESVIEYLLNLLELYPTNARGSTYSVAFAWGFKAGDNVCSRIANRMIKAMDIVSYKFDKPWEECNPEGKPHFYMDNNYDEEGALCETGNIILGKEGELRRKTKNLEDFLNRWPDIGELGSLV